MVLASAKPLGHRGNKSHENRAKIILDFYVRFFNRNFTAKNLITTTKISFVIKGILWDNSVIKCAQTIRFPRMNGIN